MKKTMTDWRYEMTQAQQNQTMTQATERISIAKSHLAVVAAADQPATMERLEHHGDPAIRCAAETMAQIVEMHRCNDYNHAREHQIAEDALFHLPMAEIERLCAEYAKTR